MGGSNAELGAALRSLRTRRQLSLESAASRVGISLSALAMYERGERVPPLPRLQKLAAFYGVGLDKLLAGMSAPSAPRSVGHELHSTGDEPHSTVHAPRSASHRSGTDGGNRAGLAPPPGGLAPPQSGPAQAPGDSAQPRSGLRAGTAAPPPGKPAPLEPRLENLPQFLRATGEVSEDLIRQIMALIRVSRGG